jgi:PPOX class probable F420-dependent enzyme
MTSLGAARYILLTTFRRTGVGVPTPVWFVVDGDELVVTTRLGSGKVKRLRNNPEVTLVECDIRGVVSPDARVLPATAVIDSSPETRARLDALMEEKYDERFREMRAAASAREVPPVSVALRITLSSVGLPSVGLPSVG